MSAFKLIPVLSISLSLGMALLSPAFSREQTTPTGDPNAAIRKTMANNNPLAELERVQKTNNQLAVQHFSGVIQKNPKDASAYARRGKAYAGLKDYEKAMKDYDDSIRLEPKTAEPYIGRAVVRFVQKDYNGSWEDVHKAESLGGQFWPSFMDALKESSKRDK